MDQNPGGKSFPTFPSGGYAHDTGDISWHSLSVPPSLCLSRFLDSGVETVRGISTKFSGWIDPPGGRVLLRFSRVRDARGTWHVPPRKGLHKFVRALIGQTRDTADSKPAGHTCTTPTCVLLWLPFLWSEGCMRQDRKTFLTWGPRVQGNFELETPNSVGG